jgi:hypothetical protein
MRLGQVISYYGVVLCFVTVVGSAWAQSDAPGISSWAVEVHRLALSVHDTGPESDSTGVFPPLIPQVLPSFDPTGIVETYIRVRRPSRPRIHSFRVSGRTAGRAPPAMNPGVHGVSARIRFRNVSTKAMAPTRFSVRSMARPVRATISARSRPSALRTTCCYPKV